MPARKSGEAALASQEKAAAFRQKREETEVRMRMECLKIAASIQSVQSKAEGLTRSAEILFKYAQSGTPVERN